MLMSETRFFLQKRVSAALFKRKRLGLRFHDGIQDPGIEEKTGFRFVSVHRTGLLAKGYKPPAKIVRPPSTVMLLPVT